MPRAFAIASLALLVSMSACMPFGRSTSLPPASDLPKTYAGPAPAPAPVARHPHQSPAAEAPTTTSVAAPSQDAPGASEWWHHFGDSALADFVRTALLRNGDLRVAWARVGQARAMAKAADAGRYPQLNAQGQATWNRSVTSFLGAASESTLLRGSLPVTYEVDWFARQATLAEAADLDTAASRADVEAAAMTISAQVAETWFDVLEARARRSLLQEQLRINEIFFDLTTLRFRQGLSTVLDAHQQRAQVAGTRAQLELVEASERLRENQLSLLLGDLPASAHYAPERATLPDTPARVEPGVPADLIEARPDIRAAAGRVRAADERVAAAMAARLPSLVLTGSAGYMWSDFSVPGASSATGGQRIGGTVSGPEFAAGATLTFPIFDGFARSAQVDLDRARVQESAERYARTIQQAMFEVDSALTQERHQREHIAGLEDQLQAARDALEVGRDRYRQGLSDFLPVLTALQAAQQTEIALLGARRQLLSFRVQLHRALGGQWTQNLEPKGLPGKSDE